MLTKEENELMCRVDNGAPMGKFLRENYWFPAALSVKVEAGGAPLRTRLIGEDFVIFRAHDGRVGMFDEHCPHRGASLALARNEDNALRCIFHGWKFGVNGTVLEVPTEPHNATDFCNKVPLRHYPVREGAGIIWAWIGEGAPAPFPDFEFMNLPVDQTYIVHQNLDCNWVQDVEGGGDSAHVNHLHKSWLGNINMEIARHDEAPIYEFESSPGGYSYVAKRNLKDGNQYCRVNRYVMPWFCFICPEDLYHGDRLVIITTPRDDTHCTHWMLRYNMWQPLGPSYANPAADQGDWPPAPPSVRAEDHWGQDRFLMKTHFTGFRHLNTEDFAVAVSQGSIAPRTREYLNHGDLAVVRLRRLLLAGVREFMDGRRPENVTYSTIRAAAGVLPKGGDWQTLND